MDFLGTALLITYRGEKRGLGENYCAVFLLFVNFQQDLLKAIF